MYINPLEIISITNKEKYINIQVTFDASMIKTYLSTKLYFIYILWSQIQDIDEEF